MKLSSTNCKLSCICKSRVVPTSSSFQLECPLTFGRTSLVSCLSLLFAGHKSLLWSWLFMVLKSLRPIQCMSSYTLPCSGWAWASSVMAMSVISFMFLDLVKVFVIKQWSFELTAKLWPTPKRKAELCRRQERATVVKRYKANVERLRKCCRAIYCISLFKKQTPLVIAN